MNEVGIDWDNVSVLMGGSTGRATGGFTIEHKHAASCRFFKWHAGHVQDSDCSLGPVGEYDANQPRLLVGSET